MKKESQAVINVKSYNLSCQLGFYNAFVVSVFLINGVTHIVNISVLYDSDFQEGKRAPMKRRREKGRGEAHQNTGRDTHAELERMHSVLISVYKLFIPQLQKVKPEAKDEKALLGTVKTG